MSLNPIKGLIGLFKPGENIEKGLGIIDQLVTDKDQADQLRAAFYLTELQTKTIPIFDAFHKLGRQLLAFGQLVFYAWALKEGHPITPDLVAGVSGPTAAYTLIKGKGK